MRVITTIGDMQRVCKELRRTSELGFVPTMGALHAGHLSLVKRARAENGVVAASIFVNPTQFAAGEDYDVYPRTFEDDCAKLEAAGVDLLFAPSVAEMYPANATTFVEVAELGDRLDGASRPGHFRGVATVVSKLFHILAPDRAYFGQKDAAQVAVLRAMVRDLNFDVELVVCPTMRESDGLAMSSRNRNLSAEERREALVLHEALERAVLLRRAGNDEAAALRDAMLETLHESEKVRVDYAAVVDADTLLPVVETTRGALLAVAAWVGKTRLIDNVLLEPVGVGARTAEREMMHA